MERLHYNVSKGFVVFQNLGMLALLAAALPLNAGVVFGALAWNRIRKPFQKPPVPTAKPKNILVTGGKMTKALRLARSFHEAGHRVILVESESYWFTGHQFSNAVDRFYTVPIPYLDPEGYTQALLSIIKRENIDVWVPVCSPISSYYDSLAKPKLSEFCEVFHFDIDVHDKIDNKFNFAESARKLNLSVPKTFKLTSAEQVLIFDFSNEKRKYIIKSIPYDSVMRLTLTQLPLESPEATAAFVKRLPISEETPSRPARIHSRDRVLRSRYRARWGAKTVLLQ